MTHHIMNRGPLIRDHELSRWVIKSPKTIRDVVEAINHGGSRTVFVVDDENLLRASVSDGDVRRALLSGSGLDSPARCAFNDGFLSIVDDELDTSPTSRVEALRMGLTELPVVDSRGRILCVEVLGDASPNTSRPNTVVIMAGGKGMRLRPLTELTPKPLIRVAGKPMLQHIIENLRGEGFSRIVVAVNYLADQIEDYFADGSRFGVNIEYVREDQPLGTAGALSLVTNIGVDPVVVMNADLILAASIAKMVDYHTEKEAVITVGAKLVEMTLPYGVLSVEGVTVGRIDEKPERRDLVNAGVYVVSPAVVSAVARDQVLDMPELIDQYLASGSVVAFPIHEAWADLGQPDDLRGAENHLGPEAG